MPDNNPQVAALHGRKLVLYDGVCGMCSALVRFFVKRDRHDRLRFAALQSALARGIVERHGGDPNTLSTLYLVENYGSEHERVRIRGKAALYCLREIGGAWHLLALLRFLPALLLDLGYRLVAANRYRLFGKKERCEIPSPEQREKFLDAADGN